MADDLGAGEPGCYGHPENRTPHLDRLAQTGVRFETCWATPLCSPTRAEIMTGRYGFRTGWYNFIGRETTRMDHISPDEPTFADMLRAHGYATGLAGKWQLGSITKHPDMILASGFDEYCVWAWTELPADAKFEGSPRQRYWHPAVIVNGKHLPTTPAQYGPDIYSGWLIDFMRRSRDKGRPFLAYYPMCLTHSPWDPTPAPGQPGGRTQGGLRANVEYMDTVVGRIVDAVEQLGLRDNTLILFTGDNGTGKAGKGTVTEKGVRVPMIVNAPRLVKPGIVSDALIDLSDVLPTLAEMTGARLLPDVIIDGRSFAPILRGEKTHVREWIFSYLGYRRMLRDRRWLLEGDGRFYDCGGRRDGLGYRDVTSSSDPAVVAAKRRFDKILEDLPGPPRDESRERPAARRLRPATRPAPDARGAAASE